MIGMISPKLSFSSWNTLSPARLFREAIRNNDNFLSDIGQSGTEDFFERKQGKGVKVVFFWKNSMVILEIQVLVMGALTQHAWHAKAQSAASFLWVFAATTSSSILCPHPFRTNPV